MKNKKYQNYLDVRETKHILREPKICTLYNISDDYIRAYQ